jgi:hypothetical protein
VVVAVVPVWVMQATSDQVVAVITAGYGLVPAVGAVSVCVGVVGDG